MKKVYRILALVVAAIFILSAASCAKPVIDLVELGSDEIVGDTNDANDSNDENNSDDKLPSDDQQSNDNTNNGEGDNQKPEDKPADTPSADDKPSDTPEPEPEPKPEPVVPKTASLVVLSQNVRYKDDPAGTMAQRAKRFALLVEEHSPDLMGLQEATHGSWTDPLKNLSDYAMIGCSRNGADATTGEWSPVLYKKERFDLIDSGTFWLTNTPNTPSKVSGAGNNRICTWAYLLDKITGEKVIMANTHLDHQNEDVRVAQAEYLNMHLNEIIKAHPATSIYFTGDFNCNRNSAPYNEFAAIYSDARLIAKKDTSTKSGTYMNYDASIGGNEIDFCFYKGNNVITEYQIISKLYKAEGDSVEGFVSDHYGVKVTFELDYVENESAESIVFESVKPVTLLSQTLFYKDNDGNVGTIAQGIKRFKLLIEERKPDLMGLQEVSAAWIESMKNLDGYEFVGSSRDGISATSGEWNPILYNTNRFCYIDGGTFWLTSTPDTVGMIEGASIKRICTWAYLYDKDNNERIMIANTHLDHSDDNVRTAQVQHLVNQLNKILESRPADTVYFTSNLNTTVNTSPYNEVVKTFSDVNVNNASSGKYFCFYNGNDTVKSYEEITKAYKADGDLSATRVSDHPGIFVVFEQSKSQSGSNNAVENKELVILSQNVYYENDSSLGTIAQGTKRLSLLIADNAPDIMGLQEATSEWVTALKSIYGYGFVGVSRDGSDKTTGEWCPIIYNTSRFTLLDSGTFWLTETPNEVSVVSEAKIKRICTWAYLYDVETSEIILMTNTHLDHQTDATARDKQVEYLKKHISDLIESRPADSVYLTGNINCGKNTDAYNDIVDMFIDTRPIEATEETYVSLSTGASYLIDFCFYIGKDTVKSYEVLTNKYQANGDTEKMQVSDHYAVKVVFEK